MHRGDPISLLNIDPVLDDLRESIKDRLFIPDLIQKLLIDNPHRVTLTMQPDSELTNRKAESEKEKLATIQRSLTKNQTTEIIKRSKILAERQMQDDDPEVLPKVGLQDIPAGIDQPKCAR